MSQGLEAVPGVIDAKVHYDDKRADVTYRPAIVAADQLVEAVNDTGFEATWLDGSDTRSDGS